MESGRDDVVTPAWWRQPGTGAYARPEREWRWLLGEVPAEVSDAVDVNDRYLRGTSLRLRHLHGAAGDVYKLTQKVRPRPDDPSVVAVTNIYLTVEEHARLAELPGNHVAKRRHRWTDGQHELAVDAFLGRWTGLVLVELEHEASAVAPAIAGAVDVSSDDRFTGGSLAAATDDVVVVVMDVVRRLVTT